MAGIPAGTPYTLLIGAEANGARQILLQAGVGTAVHPVLLERALVLLQVDEQGHLLSEDLIAKHGDALPGIAPQTVVDFGSSMALSDAGDLLFAVRTTGPTTADAAIYLGSTLIAREGDPSPLPGLNWASLAESQVELSNNGLHFAYSGYLEGGTASDHVIVRDGALFVREGDTLPDIVPFPLADFGEAALTLSAEGSLLWFGWWSEPFGLRTGLFLDERLLMATKGLLVDQFPSAPRPTSALSDSGRLVGFVANKTDPIPLCCHSVYVLDLYPPKAFCFGDGDGTACPCGNFGGADQGCANSSGQGAVLAASGSGTISIGDTVLHGSNPVPGQAGLYFQGNHAAGGGAGNFWGDGLRCAGGSVARLQVRAANAQGNSSTTANIAVAGGVVAGQVRRYQLWPAMRSRSPAARAST